MKVIQKVKEKSCKMFLNIKNTTAKFTGIAMGLIMSTIMAHAEAETGTGGVWNGIANWINNNATGLKIVCYSLIGLCVIAAALMIAINGSQGLSKVKNWLIGLVVAVVILVFGATFIDSLKTI